uniref:Reverse transcriptase domain-containing protein n=1 Tax=Oryza brachyantha TaxID=4533 RepID=J3N4A8_ORYBR
MVLSILQYAGDTIIFMDHNLDANNLCLVLSAFEKLTGLNFYNSKLFYSEDSVVLLPLDSNGETDRSRPGQHYKVADQLASSPRDH